MNDSITFTLQLEGEMHAITTSRNAYESLMCFISENFNRRNFGICYGGGCCGTCGVVIMEAATGSRKFVPACEVPIDHAIDNKTIILL